MSSPPSPPPPPPQDSTNPPTSITISALNRKKTDVNDYDHSRLRPPKKDSSSVAESASSKNSASVATKSFRAFGAPLRSTTSMSRTMTGTRSTATGEGGGGPGTYEGVTNLEKMVEAVSKALTDEDGLNAISRKHCCTSVTFDPVGCRWDATVVPINGEEQTKEEAAIKAFENGLSFKIRLVCSEVEGDDVPDGGEKAEGGGGVDPGFPEGYTPHDSDSDSDEEDDEMAEPFKSYVVDINLVDDQGDVKDYDDEGEDAEKVEYIKKVFDEIGYDIKKALVRCEMPEFPEGCKGRAFRDLYQLNARLKSGSFATVCRGTHRATGRKVAIKCVLRKDLPASDDAAIYDEVLILSLLKHRYIVPLIDFFEEKECYFLVMELMSGGDLFDRIGKKKSYSERDARDLCRKMVEAVKFCHDNGIAHCDMKPKNLLLKSDDDDSFIKLADFGFATRVYKPNSLTKQCGTPFFVAPEILMRTPYDQMSDMWSVGVIIYLLLSGDLPFMGRSQRELFRKIVIGKYEFHEEAWSHVSEEAKNLVRGLLVTDPSKRMSAFDAMNSPWIRQRANLLERNKLMYTSQRLRTFNARMKLRSAMIAVNWVSSARLLTRTMSQNMKKMEAEKKDENKEGETTEKKEEPKKEES